MLMKIDSYSFGKMKINHKLFTTDLILNNQEIKSNWWRREGHRLHMEDLDFVIHEKPRILIIGTGAYGMMDVPLPVIKELQEKYQIEVLSEPTGKAIELFNTYNQKNEKVMGAFHLTC